MEIYCCFKPTNYTIPFEIQKRKIYHFIYENNRGKKTISIPSNNENSIEKISILTKYQANTKQLDFQLAFKMFAYFKNKVFPN